ncbi:hypothetical protein [Streptomyces ossamyceticus]|uniref:hypothetical protein n=1 Tax=Streptomyces ossamyceticus TaxID=249581 RepID=UPI003EBB2A4F
MAIVPGRRDRRQQQPAPAREWPPSRGAPMLETVMLAVDRTRRGGHAALSDHLLGPSAADPSESTERATAPGRPAPR